MGLVVGRRVERVVAVAQLLPVALDAAVLAEGTKREAREGR